MKGDIKKKIVIIIIIGLLLIAFLTCGLIYFLKNNFSKNTYLYNIKVDNKAVKVYEDKILVNDIELNYSVDSVQKFVEFLDNNFDAKDKIIDINIDSLDDYKSLIIYDVLNRVNEKEFMTSIEDCVYSVYLNYQDANYIIYLKDNNLVHVKKVRLSDDKLKIIDIEKAYNLDFSKDNNDKIINYIKSLFSNEKATRLYKDNVESDEEGYINSIINNDEGCLKNKEDVYTLKYSGIDCLTPVLYLYPDNTYEYYYTFTVGDKKPTPIKGVYSINMQDLIDLSINAPQDYTFSYILEGQGNSYFIDPSLELVNILLSETNAILMTCLVQE